MSELTVSEFKNMVEAGDWERDQMIFPAGTVPEVGSNGMKIAGFISVHSKLKNADIYVSYVTTFRVDSHSEIAELNDEVTVITIGGVDLENDSELYQCLTKEFKKVDLDFLKLEQRAKLIDANRTVASLANVG